MRSISSVRLSASCALAMLTSLANAQTPTTPATPGFAGTLTIAHPGPAVPFGRGIGSPTMPLEVLAAVKAAEVIREDIEMSGPRIGVMVASGKMVKTLREDYNVRQPVMAIFGWQFEHRMFTIDKGPTGMFELVPAIAGFDKGLIIPTVSGLVAVRSARGYELGMGPNASPAGGAVVIAAGYNFLTEEVGFPVTAAIVSSPAGTRFSFTTGFTLEKSR